MIIVLNASFGVLIWKCDNWPCQYAIQGNQELAQFADKLEEATLSTIESGKMTKDLALITSIENPTVLNSEQFILAIRETLDTLL